MKKCPFCKAEIEENAKFCLYCMKSLEEKTIIREKRKFRWLLIAAGVCLLALVVWLLWPKNPAVPIKAPAQIPETTAPSVPQNEETQPDTTVTEKEEPSVPENVQPEQPPVIPQTNPKPPIEPQIPNPTDPPAPIQPDITEPEPTEPPVTEPEPTDPPATEPEPPTAAPVYSYRLAQRGDDFYANYTNPGNDIVITGIQTQIESGIYDIPAYIDGYRVLTIDSLAFYGSNAKVVYVPATVRNIGMNAFYGCDLRDIYLRGDSINISFDAFSSSLIIHCSAQCDDRNYRYFKNSAHYYGATWEEWNG